MNQNIKFSHPEWATRYKKPGTELRFIRGCYYLYEYKTVYDQVRKKPKKISGKLLGSITEKQGFISSSKRNLENTIHQKVFKQVKCKEYGVSLLITEKFDIYSKAQAFRYKSNNFN